MPRPTPTRTTLLPLLLGLLLAATARADLQADVEAAARDDGLRGAAVGVSVVALGESRGDDQAIASIDAGRPLIPASNLKLVTTGAALDRLGADFRFRTVLARRGDDLALVGDGDPALGDAELLAPLGWTATTTFEKWADVLLAAGVRSVRDVVVDDSVFDQEFLHPNWPADQISKSYVPQVAGANLNANLLDFTLTSRGPGRVVGYRTDPPTGYASVENSCVMGNDNAVVLGRFSGTNRIRLAGETNAATHAGLQVTVDDPAAYAVTVLAETLVRKGIAVTGSVRRDRTVRGAMAGPGGGGWSAVAVLETPMRTVLGRLNKDSMNVYAEALCKRLGHAATGQPGSWATGTAAMGDYLRSIGVPAEQFSLDGGSGLSRQNTVSPAALTAVLADGYHRDSADALLESLSVAGSDGTLSRRFGSADMQSLQRRVFGKSGYVNGVSTLSGYLRAADGRWYAFSVLANDVAAVGRAKAMQERVVKAVDDWASANAATRVGG